MSNNNDGLDGLGEQLKRILGDALPPGVNVEGVKVLGVPSGKGNARRLLPATLANLQGLLEGTNQPKFEIGDIVMLRPWAHGRYKWPTNDDRCIVTQVLDTPLRSGEDGTGMEARAKDIALAFIDPDGDVMEFLHDGRMFQKVGSIYDPVTLPDGEQLPVH